MKKEGEKVIEVLEQRFLNLMVKTTWHSLCPSNPERSAMEQTPILQPVTEIQEVLVEYQDFFFFTVRLKNH